MRNAKLLNCLVVFGFFVGVFLWRPGTAFAVGQACCPAGTRYTSTCNSNPGCYAVLFGSTVSCDAGKKSASACTGSEDCNSSNICGVKAPSCPPDHPLLNILNDTCCKGQGSVPAMIYGATCITGVKKYCGSDGLFIYNDSTAVCDQVAKYDIDLFLKCDNGVAGEGVQSAIGCIPVKNLPAFLAFILKFALGAAGGITLLMFIATGYSLITSTGNPEKLQAVKENLTSIFAGLIMIGFSLVLLQTIGAGVLQLPGF